MEEVHQIVLEGAELNPSGDTTVNEADIQPHTEPLIQDEAIQASADWNDKNQETESEWLNLV